MMHCCTQGFATAAILPFLRQTRARREATRWHSPIWMAGGSSRNGRAIVKKPPRSCTLVPSSGLGRPLRDARGKDSPRVGTATSPPSTTRTTAVQENGTLWGDEGKAVGCVEYCRRLCCLGETRCRSDCSREPGQAAIGRHSLTMPQK